MERERERESDSELRDEQLCREIGRYRSQDKEITEITCLLIPSYDPRFVNQTLFCLYDEG